MLVDSHCHLDYLLKNKQFDSVEAIITHSKAHDGTYAMSNINLQNFHQLKL